MPFGFNWLELAQIFNALSVPVLTLFLAIIYLKMARTQSDQTEILGRQESLMEAEHLPVLQAGDTHVVENRERDVLSANIKNTGNGIAKNIQVGCKIFTFKGDAPKTPSERTLFDNQYLECGRSPMWKLENEGVLSGEGDVIRPGDDDYFIGPIRFYIRPSKEPVNDPNGPLLRRLLPFPEVVDLFRENGFGVVAFYFYLYYEDIAGIDRQHLIAGRIAEMEEGATMEEVMSEGDPIDAIPTEERTSDSRLKRWALRR